MRLVEIRSYKLKAQSAEAFHRLMREQAAPMLERWGTDVVAFGLCPQEEDAYFLIRSYQDLIDLKQRQAAFFGSEEWRCGPREAIVERIETFLNTLVWLSDAGVVDLRISNRGTQGPQLA